MASEKDILRKLIPRPAAEVPDRDRRNDHSPEQDLDENVFLQDLILEQNESK